MDIDDHLHVRQLVNHLQNEMLNTITPVMYVKKLKMNLPKEQVFYLLCHHMPLHVLIDKLGT